jgi:hypothetical protein
MMSAPAAQAAREATAAERKRITELADNAGIRVQCDDDSLRFSTWLDIIDGIAAAGRGETVEWPDLLDGDPR